MEVTPNIKYLPANITQYIVDGNDGIINVDTSLNPITVVLPNIYNGGFANTAKGFVINDVGGNAATNPITIGAVGNTVNSASTVQITSNGGSAKASIADQSEWFVVTEPSSSGGGGTTVFFITGTYAEILALKNASTLIPGCFYKISDRADLGIIIQATSTDDLTLAGSGVFLNPDYQNVLLPSDFKEFVGVWYSGLGGLVLGESVVAWNGLQYVNITGSNGGTNPSVDTTNWTVMPKATNLSNYYREVDDILYDFVADTLIYRADNRGNKISKNLTAFQWGNDVSTNNVSDNSSTLNNINSRGETNRNILTSNSTLVLDNTFSGDFKNNILGESISLTVINAITIDSCSFLTGSTISIGTNNHVSKTISSGFSNFESNIDMSTEFATGSITIPTSSNYVGIFNLINNSAQTISKIVNMPTNHECFFKVENGNNQIFSHTAIGSAVLDNLVSDAATSNTVTGRTNGGDYISYKRSGTLNVRSNVVILA